MPQERAHRWSGTLFPSGVRPVSHGLTEDDSGTVKVPAKRDTTSCARGFYRVMANDVAGLSPGYFALVMATGIVSLSADYFGFVQVARMLFYLNAFAYLLLCCLYILRSIFFRKEMLSDFNDHARNPSFLTFVAGTCILGNQFVLLARNYSIASVLFAIAVAAWFFFIYAFFVVITIKTGKPSLDKAISGMWLLVVVATQAVCILGTLMAGHFPAVREYFLLFAGMLFCCGALFYLIMITLVVYRLSFFELRAEEFAPPYWINMGAVAITTLAGSTLIGQQGEWYFASDILPFLKGFTFLFWSIATWWIPLILILSIWRNIVNHLPFRYQAQYWGMVFPLGMYSLATAKFSELSGLPLLGGMASLFVYVAMFSWSVVFLSMVFRLWKTDFYRRLV